jgi:uncharacterized protein (DUF885 family)
MRGSVLIIALIAVLFLIGCTQPQPSIAKAAGWDAFLNEFVEAYFAENPNFAVYSGRHEFDGKLPDWSPSALSKRVEKLRSIRKRALEFNSTSLDERQHFERDYLMAVIDKDLFWIESAEWPYKNPTFYSDAIDPNVYVAREYAPLAKRMRAYTDYARAIPSAVKQIKSNLRTPMPRPYVEIGKKTFGGLVSYYEKDVPAVFSSVKDPQLEAEFKAANEEAIKAMRELEAWFDSLKANATDSFALGPDLFTKMLRETERVEIDLDQLEKIGKQDLERNQAALKKACDDYAPGATIPDCVAKSQASKPEGGAVEGARRQLRELKTFLIAKDLVTIPGTEESGVAEAPSYKAWNFAYIEIPGPFEKGLSSVYYVAPPDPSWTKAERDAYIPGKSDLLFTSVHEVWPGHFLQYLHSNRSKSKFGQIFVGYAFSEGWAHYTEEMMWEAGLGNEDPGIHIGQILNALLRDARFLSAIGLHTKGMKVEESERMFLEQAYQDTGNARQQAARGTFDPAYLNYTMGKLMIRKLREDWTASRGGRKAWREFHDKFLSFGGPPIPLVRKEMLGSDAKTSF